MNLKGDLFPLDYKFYVKIVIATRSSSLTATIGSLLSFFSFLKYTNEVLKTYEVTELGETFLWEW